MVGLGPHRVRGVLGAGGCAGYDPTSTAYAESGYDGGPASSAISNPVPAATVAVDTAPQVAAALSVLFVCAVHTWLAVVHRSCCLIMLLMLLLFDYGVDATRMYWSLPCPASSHPEVLPPAPQP